MTVTTRKYFAYGSNLFAARLRLRVPSAKAVGVYKLAAHDLRFHKRGGDGSGKCDAFATGDDADTVVGRLFEIAPADEAKLDAAEGLGVGYEKKTVTVTGADGERAQAFTYRATDTDAALRPYKWYRQHVVAGAVEADFPDDYIQKIRAVAADDDPDRDRAREQWALHRGTHAAVPDDCQ